MGSSFKDRFANKISVMGKDGRATRIDGNPGSNREARETQYSSQGARQSPSFPSNSSYSRESRASNPARKKPPAQQGNSAEQGYASKRREARPRVDYQPYTIQDYRNNCQPGKWEKLGCLGPDLQVRLPALPLVTVLGQDEELLNKRAQKERLKDYSEKLRQVNAEAIEDDVFSRPVSDVVLVWGELAAGKYQEGATKAYFKARDGESLRSQGNSCR